MKYVCIRQHDTSDCGAACLAIIAKQYGSTTSITRIREIAGTDKDGTNAYGVIKAAERIGFNGKAVKAQKEIFDIDMPLPCIAHVVVNDMLQHYVVIHKITSKYILIADPGYGMIKLSREEFVEAKRTKEGRKYQWTGVLILVTPKKDYTPNKEYKNVFFRFLGIIIKEKKLLFNIVLASILCTLIGIVSAYYYSTLIDYVLPEKLKDTLTVLSIGTIGLYIVRILLNAFRAQMVVYLGQRIDITLLLGYYKHVLNLPMNFFGTRRVGDLISRFSDASSVREAISSAALTMMIDSVMAIVGAVLLYTKNSSMFFMTVAIVVCYGIIVVLFNGIYRKLNRKTMESSADLTSYLVESLNGMQTIKTYNSEKRFIHETETRFVKMLRSVFDLSFTGNVQASLKAVIEMVGGLGILWIGGVNVINGNMTIGELITFNSLVGYFLDPIKNIINLQPQLQTATVAAERLSEILDLEIEKNEKENTKVELDKLDGKIEIKDVSFRYGTRKKVLENINLDILPGEKVAFVGESGSGKSTLTKLLLHLYEVDSGNILINNLDINDIKLDTLRDRIAYISQETFLFTGTIYDNLTLGHNGYKFEDVVEACKKAQIYDFINSQPLRFNTKLEENGSNLSGGQRQRLSIARALLRKTDILILDEATSNLDASTENLITQTMNEHCKDITTIMIAHRLSTIKHCDKICVFDQGKIVEMGNHNELLDMNGVYARLVKQQSLERIGEIYE